VFDVLILGALAYTIYHCLHLSRQFNQMQADRKAFEALIQSLNVAASRAQTAVQSMKEAAMHSGDELQEKISRAAAIFDELEIIVQAGNSLADRLNGLAEKGRKAQTESVAIDIPAEEAPMPRSRAEKELLEAMRAKQKQ